jgi:hypothetical protein
VLDLGIRATVIRIHRQIHGFLTYPARFAHAAETADDIGAFLREC